jgi:hypothetical protein
MRQTNGQNPDLWKWASYRTFKNPSLFNPAEPVDDVMRLRTAIE